MNRSLSVAIVGAGVCGLASALFLHRAGHDVIIYEAFAAPEPVGSGLMLQPTGLAVLQKLGLAEEILQLGNVIDGLVGTDAISGRKVLDVSYQRERSGQFGLAVHRAALFDVLHNAVLDADIKIVCNSPVFTCRQQNGKVFPIIDDQEEFPVDLLLDCSGAKSALRDGLNEGFKRKMLEYGAFWTTLDWIDEGFQTNVLQQRYEKASVMIGVLPIGRSKLDGPRKAAFFWSLKPEDVDDVWQDGLDAWKHRVEGYWPQTAPLLGQVTDFDQLTFAEYGHHTLREPHNGRVLHMGDSAHSTSPQLGQGANMALLDAASLAHALEGHDDVDAAIITHSKARRWHVELYQALSLGLTPFYQSDSQIIPVLRDFLVGTIGHIPPVPLFLCNMVAGTLIDPLKNIGVSRLKTRG